MVDAARQMLDELMGRNRNLHPSEAGRKINWEDPEFCQYHIVKFCPHDLFINTRADLGPCPRIHDDEAKQLYDQARPNARKRQYEDEFLRFCSTMLNDVDRKIQKGKQRLQLMHRDQSTVNSSQHLSKYQEQVSNLNARIKKLLTEAEEAGIRGDVDQAQDLMTLCEQLKDEKEKLVAQHEIISNKEAILLTEKNGRLEEKSPCSDGETSESNGNDKDSKDKDKDKDKEGKVKDKDKKVPTWMHDLGTIPEKQMEVCEICGAFLIVGDAQQRIEDHLMGKQHLGYSRLRKAVEEIHEKRAKEREDEERRRRDERSQRNAFSFDNNRKSRDVRDYRERERDYERVHRESARGHSREHSSRHTNDRHRHHHHKSHRRRSRSNSNRSNRYSRDHFSRSRSRSRH